MMTICNATLHLIDPNSVNCLGSGKGNRSTMLDLRLGKQDQLPFQGLVCRLPFFQGAFVL